MPDEAVDINGEEYKKVADNFCQIFYIMDIVSTMSIPHSDQSIPSHLSTRSTMVLHPCKLPFLLALFKVRVSSDNILKSKLVLVKISKVGIQSYIVSADRRTGGWRGGFWEGEADLHWPYQGQTWSDHYQEPIRKTRIFGESILFWDVKMWNVDQLWVSILYMFAYSR